MRLYFIPPYRCFDRTSCCLRNCLPLVPDILFLFPESDERHSCRRIFPLRFSCSHLVDRACTLSREVFFKLFTELILHVWKTFDNRLLVTGVPSTKDGNRERMLPMGYQASSLSLQNLRHEHATSSGRAIPAGLENWFFWPV